MKTILSRSLIFILINSLFYTSSTQAFLSPKQKGKIRTEQRLQRENPDNEYIYCSTWFCNVAGTACVVAGLLETIITLDPCLSGSGQLVFGIAGPFTLATGIALLKRAQLRGAEIVINDVGIQTRDHGLLLWEEIDFVIPDRTTYNATMTFVLKDGSICLLDGTVLSTTREKFLKKTMRYRKVVSAGNSIVFLAYDEE